MHSLTRISFRNFHVAPSAMTLTEAQKFLHSIVLNRWPVRRCGSPNDFGVPGGVIASAYRAKYYEGLHSISAVNRIQKAFDKACLCSSDSLQPSKELLVEKDWQKLRTSCEQAVYKVYDHANWTEQEKRLYDPALTVKVYQIMEDFQYYEHGRNHKEIHWGGQIFMLHHELAQMMLMYHLGQTAILPYGWVPALAAINL